MTRLQLVLVSFLVAGGVGAALALDPTDMKIDDTHTNNVYQGNGDSGAPKRDAPVKTKKKSPRKAKPKKSTPSATPQ